MKKRPIDLENAPTFAPAGGEVDLTRITRLGTFTLPAGVVSGSYSINGPALASFLNADANRSATLIVVRETSEPRRNAAVHGFAGNHHPPSPNPPCASLSRNAGR